MIVILGMINCAIRGDLMHVKHALNRCYLCVIYPKPVLL